MSVVTLHVNARIRPRWTWALARLATAVAAIPVLILQRSAVQLAVWAMKRTRVEFQVNGGSWQSIPAWPGEERG